MDVVDLHDFIQFFRLPRHPKSTMKQDSKIQKQLRQNSTSSTSSTLTSPEQSGAAAMDLEKSQTQESKADTAEIQSVTTALDWTGPDDPENPENWSTRKKAYHIAYVGLQCFVM